MEPAGIEPAVFRMPSERYWRALSPFPLVYGPKLEYHYDILAKIVFVSILRKILIYNLEI